MGPIGLKGEKGDRGLPGNSENVSIFYFISIFQWGYLRGVMGYWGEGCYLRQAPIETFNFNFDFYILSNFR